MAFRDIGQSGFMQGLQGLSPLMPIIGGVGNAILSGINTRAARRYNTPSAQMQRLREAGLSTSMMYGNTGQVSVPTGPTQTPSLGFDQLPSSLYQQQKTELTESQTAVQRDLEDYITSVDKYTGKTRGWERNEYDTTYLEGRSSKEQAEKFIRRSQQRIQNETEVSKIQTELAELSKRIYDAIEGKTLDVQYLRERIQSEAVKERLTKAVINGNQREVMALLAIEIAKSAGVGAGAGFGAGAVKNFFK